MSNRPKNFRKALNASSNQFSSTFNSILPSSSSTNNKNPESDSTDLWQRLWARGEMACLFGEPCVGKSILAMQIANELKNKQLSVIYFDLENFEYPVKPLVETCSPSDYYATPDEKLQFIAQEIADKKPQAVIIDEISLLTDSKDPFSMRQTLNSLRIISRHNGTAMLLIAHSKKLKKKDLATTDELQHPYEIMHACDSVFSLTETSRHNATTNQKTHYIKQHKNRMAPVFLGDDAVMAMQLTTTDDKHLIFTNIHHDENERQLVRDNGFRSRDEINKAIAHYRALCYSTREISAIVGLSQAQVSRIAKAQQEESDASDSRKIEEIVYPQWYIDTYLSKKASNSSLQGNETDASDSCNASEVRKKSQSSIASCQLAP